MRVASKRVVLGPTTAKYLAVGFVAVLALAAVFQKGAVVSTNYKNREVRGGIASVRQDLEALSLERSRQLSLEALKASAVAQELVPVESYVTIGEGVVAGVATSR